VSARLLVAAARMDATSDLEFAAGVSIGQSIY
jgi:hypothetical protein